MFYHSVTVISMSTYYNYNSCVSWQKSRASIQYQPHKKKSDGGQSSSSDILEISSGVALVWGGKIFTRFTKSLCEHLHKLRQCPTIASMATWDTFFSSRSINKNLACLSGIFIHSSINSLLNYICLCSGI